MLYLQQEQILKSGEHRVDERIVIIAQRDMSRN